MPKTNRSDSIRQERRHNPLSEEYAPTAPLKQKAGKKRKSQDIGEGAEDTYVDSKASRRILDLGQGLAAEDEAERNASRPQRARDESASLFQLRDDVSDEDDDLDEGGAVLESGAFADDDEAWGSEEEVEEIEVDPQDLETFNKFNPSFDPATLLGSQDDEDEDPEGPGTNLADLILEKIAAHEASHQAGGTAPAVQGGGAPDDAVELPAKVVEVYTQVGILLSRYKSGKLPKPFKVLPTLPQWDILISITRPESWTPNAVYEATKLFVSSRPALAQAFISDILLPNVRDDIHETKKLNVHLYKSLKKSIYKPAAFFRGLLFPLAASGTCTLREATIISSVIQRVSIPVLHSATALYRLCEIAAEQMMHDVESAGACNIFIRTLLEKKYALPYRVVDALVFHFLRFKAVQTAGGDTDMDGGAGRAFGGKKSNGKITNELPVLWHQCLLAFVQRYKNEVTEDQREALLDLLLVRGHKQIGPEIRRELLEGRGRGVTLDAKDATGGDDTMMDM
ncbi:Bystin-domain-containing protein [Polychaeton citri CBS 116435]|uniref:Bystin-domain-containing protein n=1 Tax=Polychaeton citri CBS 116435 TaxID=1314669 RepID=A0A9P4Q590_9PEZI|nr:Bystin-domain-containing protein [Polychaeton citri CBS 116435]